MLTGKPPFLDIGHHELSESAMLSMMQRIKAGSYSQDSPQWQGVSDDAKKLVRGTVILVLGLVLGICLYSFCVCVCVFMPD